MRNKKDVEKRTSIMVEWEQWKSVTQKESIRIRISLSWKVEGHWSRE